MKDVLWTWGALCSSFLQFLIPTSQLSFSDHTVEQSYSSSGSHGTSYSFKLIFLFFSTFTIYIIKWKIESYSKLITTRTHPQRKKKLKKDWDFPRTEKLCCFHQKGEDSIWPQEAKIRSFWPGITSSVWCISNQSPSYCCGGQSIERIKFSHFFSFNYSGRCTSLKPISSKRS